MSDPTQPSALKLVKTCDWAPEQYDVLNDGKIVGYLRLRWGYFTAEACTGDYAYATDPTLVYDHVWPNDEYKGGFADEDEARSHLSAALAALETHYASLGGGLGV